jgi:hypothetical protein
VLGRETFVCERNSHDTSWLARFRSRDHFDFRALEETSLRRQNNLGFRSGKSRLQIIQTRQPFYSAMEMFERPSGAGHKLLVIPRVGW